MYIIYVNLYIEQSRTSGQCMALDRIWHFLRCVCEVIILQHLMIIYCI